MLCRVINLDVPIEALVEKLSSKPGNTPESITEKAEAHYSNTKETLKKLGQYELKVTASTVEELCTSLDNTLGCKLIG